MSTIQKHENQTNKNFVRKHYKQATVVVMDTDAGQREMIRSAIDSNNVKIVEIETVKACLDFVENNFVDLMLLDYALEDGTALGLIKTLDQQYGKKIPFIISTASGNEKIAVEAMKQGALDYIIKDNTIEQRLAQVVSSSLSQVRTAQLLEELDGELTQFEHRTRLVLDTSAEAFVSVDGYGTIIDWNKTSERIFGYETQSIVGRNITETIVPVRYREAVSGFLHSFQESHEFSEELHSFESTALRSDGSEFPVAVSMNVVALKDNWIITAFAHDISKRCELESQLVHSEKMASLGQLAAGVAHEINNPVGFVTSNVSTLSEYLSTFKNIISMQGELISSIGIPEEHPASSLYAQIEKLKEEEDYDFICDDTKELLSESSEGLVRVKEIVQNLKSFARVDEAEAKEADINECLKTTIKVVWSELKYNCELIEEYETLPQLLCYPGQLNQVFMNLLVNASHAIKERGTIKISTTSTNEHIVIKIKDTGSGIKPEHLSNLFTPFFTTKPVGKGTGLGLSIAYGIIQKHNGNIEVESELEVGTTFTVKLPLKGVEV